MGVYIKGMEMPNGLGKTITIYPNGMVRVWVNNKGSGELLEQRAVPVPEHGRLIDADVLEELTLNDPSCITVFEAIKKLQGMPTVIPASGGAEDEWEIVSVPQPQINADDIRSMTDEELAKWFCRDRECDTQHCPYCKMDGCHIEEWLKSPVEVDNG